MPHPGMDSLCDAEAEALARLPKSRPRRRRRQGKLFRCEAKINKGKGRRCKRQAYVFLDHGSFCSQHATIVSKQFIF